MVKYLQVIFDNSEVVDADNSVLWSDPTFSDLGLEKVQPTAVSTKMFEYFLIRLPRLSIHDHYSPVRPNKFIDWCTPADTFRKP